MGELQSDFCKISQNFIKSPLKSCLISQISVHILWHVCLGGPTTATNVLNCSKQSWCSYGLKWAWLIRKVILTQSCTFVLPPYIFMAILGLPWEIVDNRYSPSMRIQSEYLKMSYGYSSVGLRVPRNVVRKFVVDRRSTTVLDGSVTVLSRPHYSFLRLSKNTYDCKRMTTFHQDWNDDWQRWTKLSYDFKANLIYISRISNKIKSFAVL